MTLKHKNQEDLLIYKMQSQDQEQKQTHSHLSTTSKSDQNRQNEIEMQISEIVFQKHLQTQIILIQPNHSQQRTTQNKEFHSFIEGNNLNTELTLQQSESPIQLKKQRRKNDVSSKKICQQRRIKSFIQKENELMVDQIEQNDQLRPQYRQGNKYQFEFDDSQRIFEMRNQQSRNNHQNNSNRKQQTNLAQDKKIMNSMQSQDSQEYEQEQQEQYFYQSSISSQEEQMLDADVPMQGPQSLNRQIKILKQGRQSILVQATIDSLVMRQIPKGLKISCIMKIKSKYLGLSVQYDLLIKGHQKAILSAKKQHFSFTRSNFIISFNENYITKRKDNSCFIGKLQSNFTGTNYNLHKVIASNNLKQTQNKQKQLRFSLQSQVNFARNIWGSKGMRQVDVFKMDKGKLTKIDISHKVDLEQVMEKKQISKIIRLKNQNPIYDPKQKKYFIDFGGKAKVPSAKNLLLVFYNKSKNDGIKHKQSQNVAKSNSLLIAKQNQTDYLVQIGHPLSIYQAFGICLANNDTKLLVN